MTTCIILSLMNCWSCLGLVDILSQITEGQKPDSFENYSLRLVDAAKNPVSLRL